MPSLPIRKLSAEPIAGNMVAGDRLPILRRPQDEADASKRNPTVSRATFMAWLGVDFIGAYLPGPNLRRDAVKLVRWRTVAQATAEGYGAGSLEGLLPYFLCLQTEAQVEIYRVTGQPDRHNVRLRLDYDPRPAGSAGQVFGYLDGNYSGDNSVPAHWVEVPTIPAPPTDAGPYQLQAALGVLSWVLAGQGTTPAKRKLLIGTGDSTMRALSIGDGTTGYTGGTGPGWWSVMKDRLAFPAIWDYVNLGYEGKSPQWVLQHKLDELLGYLDASKYDEIILVVGFPGGNGITSQFSRTPTQEVDDLLALCQAAKDKASITKTIVTPYINRTDSYASSTQDADRQSVNSGLQQYSGSLIDYKPLASSQLQVLQSSYPSLAAYCYDGVHFTGSGGANGKGGAGVYAELGAQAVALAAGRTLANPAYRQNLDYNAAPAMSTITVPSASFHPGGFQAWVTQGSEYYSSGTGLYNNGGNDSTEYYEVFFEGDGFDVYSPTNDGGGAFNVYVDDALQPGSFTAYSSDPMKSKVVAAIRGLALGVQHKARVVKTGGAVLYCDRFDTYNGQAI